MHLFVITIQVIFTYFFPLSSPTHAVGSPTYSDPLSPRPSESSPVGSPLSTATSVSPTHKRARPHLNHPPGGGTCPPVVRTRRGSSVEHSQSSSEDGSRLPPSSNARYARNPSKLMPLGNGDRAVVIGDKAVVTLVSDVPEIPSVRPKRGPFHRGSQKVRPAPQGEAGHPTLTPPSLPIPLTSVVAKTTTPPAPPPTSGMAGSSDLVRSPLTRSSSAALKSVEFISLPGRKRRRRGEEGSGGGDPAGVSPLDSTSPEVDPPKMGLGSAESPAAKSDRDGSSPVDTPLIKRKRGRPPKKRREMVGPLTSTGPQSADTFVPSESCGGGGGDGTPTQSAPDTHSSPMSVASAGGMAGNSVIGRLSTPSPQTILVFEESPLPPAVSMKPSVEHHVGQRGGDPGQRGDLGPVLLGKVGETVTKATPTAKAALPDINLPLWESFNTKQVCSQEQKAGSDINRTTTVQSALKPGRLSEFGCVAMPTIPSLLPQTAPKTTSSQLPLHCSASDLVHSTYANSTPSAPSSTPSAPSSTFSASSSSITISTSSTHNTSESKHEPLLPVVCVEQPNARLVKPNGHTPSIPPLTLAPVGGSCDTPVTAPHAAEEKREVAVKEGGRGKGEEQQPKKVGVVSAEVLSEVKEQRHTDAHDGAAIASAPDGESPAKPEGEKAEAMGAEPSYLTKPAPSPPSVGYKPKDPSRQDRPLDSSAAPAPTLHAPPPAQPNKSSGERKDAEPSWDQKVPSNATAQEPDSKPPRSKTIQDPELPVAPPTSLCYTLANPVAHYPPSSYPYGSTYPLVYPPSNAPPIYPPYYPSQQMPTAYLPGLHPPLSTEQTSGYYATPLSQVTSRPLAAAPVATTVSGVRVAILDKPPPQLPPTQGGRPFVGTSGGSFPPQPPGEHSQPPTSRPFMSAEPQPGMCYPPPHGVCIHSCPPHGVCIHSWCVYHHVPPHGVCIHSWCVYPLMVCVPSCPPTWCVYHHVPLMVCVPSCPPHGVCTIMSPSWCVYHHVPLMVCVPSCPPHGVCTIMSPSWCVYHHVPLMVCVPSCPPHGVCTIMSPSWCVYHHVPPHGVCTIMSPSWCVYHHGVCTPHGVCTIMSPSWCVYHHVPLMVCVPSCPPTWCVYHHVPLMVCVPSCPPHGVCTIMSPTWCVYHPVPHMVCVPSCPPHVVCTIMSPTWCVYHHVPLMLCVPSCPPTWCVYHHVPLMVCVPSCPPHGVCTIMSPTWCVYHHVPHMVCVPSRPRPIMSHVLV